MSSTTAKTLPSGAASATRLFKAAAGLTFTLGVDIHFDPLVIGIESFVREIYTPPADIAFAVLILTAAIAGLLSWRRYAGGRAGPS